MQSTLAFAPTAEDLEDDLFGVPVAFFDPPPVAVEDTDAIDAAQPEAA